MAIVNYLFISIILILSVTANESIRSDIKIKEVLNSDLGRDSMRILLHCQNHIIVFTYNIQNGGVTKVISDYDDCELRNTSSVKLKKQEYNKIVEDIKRLETAMSSDSLNIAKPDSRLLPYGPVFYIKTQKKTTLFSYPKYTGAMVRKDSAKVIDEFYSIDVISELLLHIQLIPVKNKLKIEDLMRKHKTNDTVMQIAYEGSTWGVNGSHFILLENVIRNHDSYQIHFYAFHDGKLISKNRYHSSFKSINNDLYKVENANDDKKVAMVVDNFFERTGIDGSKFYILEADKKWSFNYLDLNLCKRLRKKMHRLNK